MALWFSFFPHSLPTSNELQLWASARPARYVPLRPILFFTSVSVLLFLSFFEKEAKAFCIIFNVTAHNLRDIFFI